MDFYISVPNYNNKHKHYSQNHEWKKERKKYWNSNWTERPILLLAQTILLHCTKRTQELYMHTDKYLRDLFWTTTSILRYSIRNEIGNYHTMSTAPAFSVTLQCLQKTKMWNTWTVTNYCRFLNGKTT